MSISEEKLTIPTRHGNREFSWGERTFVMGILNVSPDSFSGDGLTGDLDIIAAAAKKMVDDGADIIDIGGESTHPGSKPITVEEELPRVIPVITRLSSELTAPISIDTYKAEVAAQAIESGAGMINDVSGLRGDPEMVRVVAAGNVPVVMVSNQRGSRIKGDVMEAVISDLKERMVLAVDAGIIEENIIIDPGIGFGKSVRQNYEIVRRLAELRILGRPILLGTSRKFMAELPPDQRLEATEASSAIGIAAGADMVRVHDVKQMVRICLMSDAIMKKAKGLL